MRQQDEAQEDALTHLGEAIDALQDADAPADVIEDAEALFTRVEEDLDR